MKVLRAYFSRVYWREGFSWSKSATAVFAAFGALWLLVEVVDYFWAGHQATVAAWWPAFLLLGLIRAAWVTRPLHSIACKMAGRDVTVSVVVGDLFKLPGALVIGTNTTFDTDTASGLIHSRSVQGQFTNQFYDSVQHLDADIAKELEGKPFSPAAESKKGKQRVYEMGTVVKLSPKGRTSYLVAIAAMGPNGNALGSFEDLKRALPLLWDHIATSGTMDPVVTPVLGTGFSRLPQPREEVVREIVDSFVAACAERRFTEGLTIVLHPTDFYKNGVSLRDLGDYVGHVCRYTQFGGVVQAPRGTAIA